MIYYYFYFLFHFSKTNQISKKLKEEESAFRFKTKNNVIFLSLIKSICIYIYKENYKSSKK